jgi:hypothetical protein
LNEKRHSKVILAVMSNNTRISMRRAGSYDSIVQNGQSPYVIGHDGIEMTQHAGAS